jgi:hypothetical protein
MHEDGRHSIEGPIRGTSAWWRGLAPQDFEEMKDRPSRSPSGIRLDLVNRVRAEIAAGTYDTPEKWEIALDRLLERLES